MSETKINSLNANRLISLKEEEVALPDEIDNDDDAAGLVK